MAGDAIDRAGRFTVDADYDDVFDALADPVTVASCLPDATGDVSSIDGDRARVDVRAGAGAVRPRISVTLTRATADRDAGLVEYDAVGEGARSRVDATGRFELESTPDGVEVSWTGRAEFGGLLASLGANVGRLETIAAEKLDEASANVRGTL